MYTLPGAIDFIYLVMYSKEKIDMHILDYNDSTMLASGPYKFTSLGKIPAKWLIKIYNQDKEASCILKKGKFGKHPDRKLIAYIEKNLESIKKRRGQHTAKEDTGFGHKTRPGGGGVKQLTCNETGKLVYVSEKEAKDELILIKQSDSEKKPVRAYECEKCGGWHLTSIPYEVRKKTHGFI